MLGRIAGPSTRKRRRRAGGQRWDRRVLGLAGAGSERQKLSLAGGSRLHLQRRGGELFDARRFRQRALLILQLRIVLLKLMLFRLRALELNEQLPLLVRGIDDGKSATENDDQQEYVQTVHGATRSATRMTAERARGLAST